MKGHCRCIRYRTVHTVIIQKVRYFCHYERTLRVHTCSAYGKHPQSIFAIVKGHCRCIYSAYGIAPTRYFCHYEGTLRVHTVLMVSTHTVFLPLPVHTVHTVYIAPTRYFCHCGGTLQVHTVGILYICTVSTHTVFLCQKILVLIRNSPRQSFPI